MMWTCVWASKLSLDDHLCGLTIGGTIMENLGTKITMGHALLIIKVICMCNFKFPSLRSEPHNQNLQDSRWGWYNYRAKGEWCITLTFEWSSHTLGTSDKVTPNGRLSMWAKSDLCETEAWGYFGLVIPLQDDSNRSRYSLRIESTSKSSGCVLKKCYHIFWNRFSSHNNSWPMHLTISYPTTSKQSGTLRSLPPFPLRRSKSNPSLCQKLPIVSTQNKQALGDVK